MQKTTAKRIFKYLKIAILIYVVIGILFYFLQEYILFHPKKLSRDHRYAIVFPYKEINLAIDNDRNLGIVQFTVPDTICKGVVLYFHGNKQNIERYAPFARYFTKNNYEVWMIDYPGYGKSTGKRSETVLYAHAMQLYKMASARFAADSIIIYGKSLGTGVAAQLASIRNCKRLILETPYYDFPSVLGQYAPIYPYHWLFHYQFPVYQYLPKVAAPISIIHGTDDYVIRHSNANKLKSLLEKKDEFISIPQAGHNNLFKFRETVYRVDSLLQK